MRSHRTSGKAVGQTFCQCLFADAQVNSHSKYWLLHSWPEDETPQQPPSPRAAFRFVERVADALPALPCATIGVSPANRIDSVEEPAVFWATAFEKMSLNSSSGGSQL
ncbi:hypothetical protein MTO96_015367 [Rhipicephalus appendiculatus]